MGGKITAIRREEGDSDRLTVFVDGERAFTVSDQVAREMGLVVGGDVAPVEPTAGGALGEGARPNRDRARAREAALRLLSVRARSENEIRLRLARKGFGVATITEVVEALKEVGLLDDSAFAEAWVDERVRLKPVGPGRLRQELATKGVPSEVVARVVDETFREYSELELARRAVYRKRYARAGGGRGDARAKTEAFLRRRGFSYEVASRVAREVAGDSDE